MSTSGVASPVFVKDWQPDPGVDSAKTEAAEAESTLKGRRRM